MTVFFLCSSFGIDGGKKSKPAPSEMFRPMTSFTPSPKTSFTLRRVLRAGGGGDALEDYECAAAAGGVCDLCQAGLATVSRFVPGVRDFSSDRVSLAASIRAARCVRDRRAQPAAAAESAAHGHRLGATRDRGARALSGLGSAQAARDSGARGYRSGAQHDPPDSAASRVGERVRPASTGAAAF